MQQRLTDDILDFEGLALFLVCTYRFEGEGSTGFRHGMDRATQDRSIHAISGFKEAFKDLARHFDGGEGEGDERIDRGDVEETIRLYEETIIARAMSGI